MRAARAINVAVHGPAQVLSAALEEDGEPEDQTEAECATGRLDRLRLWSRQLGGSDIAGLLVLIMLNLYRL